MIALVVSCKENWSTEMSCGFLTQQVAKKTLFHSRSYAEPPQRVVKPPDQQPLPASQEEQVVTGTSGCGLDNVMKSTNNPLTFETDIPTHRSG